MTESAPVSMSKERLLWALSFRFILTAIIVGALLFGFAGSLQYWHGWLFMVALFVPLTVSSVYLWRKDPSLLEKRMRIREREKEQKLYVRLSLLWFLVSMAIPGLDFRYGWSHVPAWLTTVSLITMLFGYILFMVAMVQNSFASRVIEIQVNQRVIDTGLYSVVRHPMYMAAIIMYTPISLVLGSYYGLFATLPLPLLLVYRIQNEERLLRAGLAGYPEYASRVRFRLVPFVW